MLRAGYKKRNFFKGFVPWPPSQVVNFLLARYRPFSVRSFSPVPLRPRATRIFSTLYLHLSYRDAQYGRSQGSKLGQNEGTFSLPETEHMFAHFPSLRYNSLKTHSFTEGSHVAEKKKQKVVEEPQTNVSGLSEADWHEFQVLIGDAIGAEAPIRITLRSKLGDKVLEGVPYAKNGQLYLRTSLGDSVQVPLDRMAKVEEAVRY